MASPVHWLLEPLQYDFMRRALIEVALMGAVTGAIGTYVVLRGLAFIGDALSHAIFPGIVIAFLLGQSILLGALAFGILTAVSIALLATNRRVKDDTAIGVLFAGTFALGVVLISTSRNFTRRFVARSAIETAVRIPKANAPRRMLSPRRNAITMPGKMAWERASPMNERPRRTT